MFVWFMYLLLYLIYLVSNGISTVSKVYPFCHGYFYFYFIFKTETAGHGIA